MKTESPGNRTTLGWAGSALILAAAIAIAGKTAGVVVAPGSRGVLSGQIVNAIEVLSGTLAYMLAALLIALVCGASFELARARSVHPLARGGVVAVSGLIVALASPAVVERLSTLPSLALAVITSLVTLVSGVVVVRAPVTRVLGGILVLLAICGLFRVVAWEASAMSFDRANHSMHAAARGFATAAVTLQAFATLLAAAWIGIRSKWRGRLLANIAILLAFALTWMASRTSDAPSALEAVLRTSLPRATALPAPYLLGSIAVFLMPASILLAGAVILQPAEQPAVVASFAFALLSNGAFDIPLQALLVTTAAQWAILAMAENRSLWGALHRSRSVGGAQEPARPTTGSA